jgi:T6SS, Phospholipase effector Tle1-like, catalytic domain
MAKNILIFSDGTGQAGGITFDEDRTNIYKLYRATRCGPDSCIHPDEQVAFYDPGLGSPADGGFMFGKTGRWMYNIASQATGLGITANIIDCYAALIRLYRDDDRIFLFGFSRGAYTVRCLAAVMAKCGIPRCMPNGKSLPLDVKGSRKLATYAVKNVYQFCSSKPRKAPGSYRNFMLDTRELIAARFRKRHGSCDTQEPAKANVYPYFVGVFDTVAALGRTGAALALLVALALVVAAISWVISFLSLPAFSDVRFIGGLLKYLTFEHLFYTVTELMVLVGLVTIIRNYVKYDFRVPGYGILKSLATIHLAPRKQKFTDYYLNVNVEYAKHAISIDEDRQDFKRVPWTPDAAREGVRDEFGNIHFEQVWFSGVHADIGGGYPENESRLSDITLKWMLAAASIIPIGIKHDDTVLRLYPDPTGPQHDECKAGHWQRGVRELPADKATRISEATMHKSVYARFAADQVIQYDVSAPYRPVNMKNHADFSHYYDEGTATSPPPPKAIADDIEAKWEKQLGASNQLIATASPS